MTAFIPKIEERRERQTERQKSVAKSAKAFYDKNREMILEVQRMYRQSDEYKARRKAYLEKHKEYLKAYRKDQMGLYQSTPVWCEACDCQYSQGYRARHFKTAKHQANARQTGLGDASPPPKARKTTA